MNIKNNEFQSFRDFTQDPYFQTILNFQNTIIDNNKPNYKKIQAISYGVINHPIFTDITTIDQDMEIDKKLIEDICPNYRIYNDKSLPYATDTMDYVVVANSFEYAHSSDNVFKELWRILKPNGKLLVMYVNLDNTDESIELFHEINSHIINLDFDLINKFNLYSLLGSNFVLNLSYLTQTSEFMDTLFNPLCLMFANVYRKQDILRMSKLTNKKLFTLKESVNLYKENYNEE